MRTHNTFVCRNKKNNYLDTCLISSYGFIALDKMLFFNQKVLIFFLFLHENIRCGSH